MYGWALLLASLAQPPETAPAAAPPPPRVVEFQPGVWIDWAAREVRVAGRVVLRAGQLEFLACWAGKEHESIIRCTPPAAHVYMALGLVGLTPGRPPQRQVSGALLEPTGDLVDVQIEWVDAGERRTASAADWLRELVYGRSPQARPWLFCGSQRLPDGSLASDASGAGIALVDFADALLCYSRRYASDYAALWAEANTPVIPPVDTPVQLRLRAAQPAEHEIQLDFRGDVYVDGRYCTLADLADLLRLGRRLAPERVQTIRTAADVLAADVLRVRETLQAAGLPTGAVRWERVNGTATRPTTSTR